MTSKILSLQIPHCLKDHRQNPEQNYAGPTRLLLSPVPSPTQVKEDQHNIHLTWRRWHIKVHEWSVRAIPCQWHSSKLESVIARLHVGQTIAAVFMVFSLTYTDLSEHHLLAGSSMCIICIMYIWIIYKKKMCPQSRRKTELLW